MLMPLKLAGRYSRSRHLNLVYMAASKLRKDCRIVTSISSVHGRIAVFLVQLNISERLNID